jgi:DNA-binding transcriptional ArsR family regulator
MLNQKVNEDGVMTSETRSRDLSAIFAALADPTRRLILERISRGEATPGELARPLRIARFSKSRTLGTK